MSDKTRGSSLGKIQTEQNAPVKVVKSDKYGKTQTAIEQDATSRGIGLSTADPEPSVVMMKASTEANILVAMLELSHK